MRRSSRAPANDAGGPITTEGAPLVDTAMLSVHPENANVGDLDGIRESIERHGFHGALVVQRSTNYIVAGNFRYMAAVALGYTKLPVLFADIDDDKARELLLIDNKTSRDGHTDSQRLLDLLLQLQEHDRPIANTGYTSETIDVLEAELERSRQNDTSFLDEHLTGASDASASDTSVEDESIPEDRQPPGAIESYVKLNFTLRISRRDSIVAKLNAYKREHDLESSADALYDLIVGD